MCRGTWREAQGHHHLASKWEELLEKARSMPGFCDFLRPRKAGELVLAASDGLIVVLNFHATCCDALIIFPGCNDITHLPLPSVSLAKLSEARVQLETMVGHRGDRAERFLRLKPALKREDTFKMIPGTLWSDVVEPIGPPLVLGKHAALTTHRSLILNLARNVSKHAAACHMMYNRSAFIPSSPCCRPLRWCATKCVRPG